MKTYKVKSLTISGLGNNIYRSGDVVSASNFPSGRAEELVLAGHLEEHSGDVDSVAAPVNDLPGKKFIDSAGNEKEVKTIEDISSDELKTELTKAGVEFGKKPKKIYLFELWMGLEVKEGDADEEVIVVSEEGKKFVSGNGEEKVAKVIDDITEEELIENLMEEKVDFNTGSAKEELWDLWFKPVTEG